MNALFFWQKFCIQEGKSRSRVVSAPATTQCCPFHSGHGSINKPPGSWPTSPGDDGHMGDLELFFAAGRLFIQQWLEQDWPCPEWVILYILLLKLSSAKATIW